MLSRTSKRIFIGFIYVLIVAVIVGGNLYFKYRPTCNDGIKNGQEEGVDCGTVACGKACVSPIQALQVQLIKRAYAPETDLTTDVAVQIYNPNTDYGVASGVYDLVVKDSSGVELDRLAGNNFYMLPGQTKYLVLTALKGLALGQDSVEVKSVEWEKVVVSQDNPFITTREALSPGSNQTIYEAVITNNSNFDFDNVDISVVVFGSAGDLVTTSVTNVQTFLSHTNRSIKVTWPFSFPSDARIKTEVNTNVFNNANFLKTNGTQEKFQQHY